MANSPLHASEAVVEQPVVTRRRSVRLPLHAAAAAPAKNGQVPVDVQQVIRDPLSQFNLGLALMSVIPLLLCCYLITVKFFSLDILIGLNAYYFLLAVIAALLGIFIGRRAIRQMIQQLIEANLRAQHVLEELSSVNAQLRRTNTELEQSQAALRTAQLHLIQAEKLEAVGQLAAGVAHEVKNPLMVILLGIQLLSKRLGSVQPPELLQSPKRQEEIASILRDLEDAVKRADTVIRGLLDFSTPQQLDMVAEPLPPVIEQSLLLVKHALDTSHITVVKDVPSDLPLMSMDQNKLQQVFVNLFMNSIHAMPTGGILTVKASTRVLSDVEAHVGRRGSDRFRVGETVLVVKVTDTGKGIPHEAMAKIFSPFFTTKQPGKGTGLGLTVTKKIVELHGGQLEIRNRRDGGVEAILMFHTCSSSSATTV